MTSPPSEEVIRELFGRLASAPRQLFEVCSGADLERMRSPMAPGKWSPLQVLAHLVGCDREALLPRVEKMIAEENPFLAAFDQETWMRQYGDVRDIKAVTLIDEYARLREKSAMLLFDLTPDEWMRTGRHEERGTVTIFDLCSYFADHDDHHRQQIASCVAPRLA